MGLRVGWLILGSVITLVVLVVGAYLIWLRRRDLASPLGRLPLIA